MLLSSVLSTTLLCASPSMAAGELHDSASTPRAAVQSYISSLEQYHFTRAADFVKYQQFKTRQQVLSFLKGFAGPDRVLQFRILRARPSVDRALVTVYVKQRFGKRIFMGNQVLETIKRQNRWFVYIPTPHLPKRPASRG